MNNCLHFEKIAPQIALVTMNRPKVHNAYNQQMVEAFEKVIQQTEQDPEILCVILTGAGQSFCAGADLKEAQLDNGKKLLSNLNGYQPLQYTQRKKIWISAVEGFALGGGFELALHCDFIIASENATFGLPEIKHNLLPLGGGIQKLNNLLPKYLLKEIILTGRLLKTAEMLKLNLIYQSSPTGQAVEFAIKFAKSLQNMTASTLLSANDLINQLDYLDDTQWNLLAQNYLEKKS
ncbi:Probable enoyl-CoA hydratase echA8 [Phocoenobacter uteri]|uniref:Probable enoyl-CoA hydratase echA8 n=1 Tax=Phocoenobacter uteri TaxID=146806 RepID=A0A379CBC1_9PAST|nr:enoyl-CoA hydratase/isomerase family protein [Phocoenobacter uteri]SUB59025.1 Probable enoyl-CoA hydratase echA8 [Phocoenobacter uteri]